MHWKLGSGLWSVVLFIFMFLVVALSDAPAFAQNAVTPHVADTTGGLTRSQLSLQRSLEIYDYRKAAQSGPERGREIFYYKCWMCHNEFSKTAPRLDGLFKQETLIDGKPVTTENVKDQIRNGSANMPAFKTTMTEADIDDLESFVEQECCWNSDAPPKNPRYIAH